jgi:hypothetical protein
MTLCKEKQFRVTIQIWLVIEWNTLIRKSSSLSFRRLRTIRISILDTWYSEFNSSLTFRGYKAGSNTLSSNYHCLLRTYVWNGRIAQSFRRKKFRVVDFLFFYFRMSFTPFSRPLQSYPLWRLCISLTSSLSYTLGRYRLSGSWKYLLHFLEKDCFFLSLVQWLSEISLLRRGCYHCCVVTNSAVGSWFGKPGGSQSSNWENLEVHDHRCSW